MILVAKITVGVILLLVAAFWNKFKWPNFQATPKEPDIGATLQTLLGQLQGKSFSVSVTYDNVDFSMHSTPLNSEPEVK